MIAANAKGVCGLPDLGRSPLIVATREALANERHREWFLLLQGPRVLLAFPGEEAELDVQEDWIVFEFEQAPPSSLSALSEVIVRIPHVLDRLDGHLLLLASPTANVAEIVSAVGPWSLEWEAAPCGDCAAMVLGPALAAHPLLADFFGNLRGQSASVQRITAALTSTLSEVSDG